MKEYLIDRILKRVEKPSRYIGCEKNIVVKDFDNTNVRFAFCFPDLYEVGMSHLGLQILYFLINSEENFLCERFFAPWVDMEYQMRENGIKLYSLENKRALDEFDIVGFTLQYEMSYSNILNMLDLGGVKKLSSERGNEDPLVIAGGPTAYNPEPLSDFFDLFIIGEGEEVNMELFKLYEKHKLKGYNKRDFLLDAARIEGIYVPSFYEVEYNDDQTVKEYKKKYEFLPDRINKRRISNLNNCFQMENLIVPFVETIHQRSVAEIFRGCTKGCRFCEAGYIYRPIREKNVDTILCAIENQVKNTGYNEISLSSLSSLDYSEIESLIKELVKEYEDRKVRISLPSLRIDSLSIDILKEIEKVRKTGLTLAPEAGSQNLRNIINKNVTEDNYIKAIRTAFDSGWSKLKLYFMIGLPGEKESDLDGIKDLADSAVREFFSRPKEDIKGNLQINISASCFVPKPFTPFQWVSQNTVEEFYEKIFYLKDKIRDKKVKFQYHDPKTSIMEGYISRGDRRTGKVILRAHELGAKFDGWSDQYKYEIWEQAIKEVGLPFEFYCFRERSLNEKLPWDIINPGVTKKYLKNEYLKSKSGELTGDCRKECNFCGIKNCEMRIAYEN